MAKNIQKMLIRQLSNPKNWTKKKIAMIAVAVLTACVANKFGHTNSQSSTVLGKKGETYTAQVVKVADGDTITVSDTYGAKHRIRFAYIDAPERHDAATTYDAIAEEIHEPDNLNLSNLGRKMVEKALERNAGNRRKAAQELGISDRTLYRRIKQYGLE